MRKGRILPATSTLLLFTMGCYVYVPLSPGSGLPPVGESVRVEVTENEAVRLNLREVLPDSPTTVQGELVSHEENAIEVLVRVIDFSDSRSRARDMFQRIEVDPAAIVRVTRRELSRSRTFVLLGGGAALVVSAILSGLGGEVGGLISSRQTDKEGPL